MTVPLSYNIRNLLERKTTTLITVSGIALSTAMLVASLALVDGLRSVLVNAANPLQLLVPRKEGDSELGSTVSSKIMKSCGENGALLLIMLASRWSCKNWSML